MYLIIHFIKISVDLFVSCAAVLQQKSQFPPHFSQHHLYSGHLATVVTMATDDM